MFDAIRNWFEVRAAMKDERRLRADQALLNTVLVEDRLKHIAEMLNIGQVAYATATMDEVMARYPDEVAELPRTVGILIDLKRLDDAEALAVRGMQRNPDSRDFMVLYGDVAERRGDIPERLRRWRSFRRRYPAYGLSFRKEADALLAAGEDDAAERLLAEGVRVVTDDVNLAIDYARRAEARRDWPEASRRWTVVRDAFEHPMGPSMIAHALVEQGLNDQAEAELQAARRRFPLEPQIIEDLAALAERRGNLDGALAHWAELRRDLPHITQGYTEAARLLRQRGEGAAADAMIGEGAARAPDNRALQIDHAALAERDGDWAEAARRWGNARKRFEADPVPYGREAAALRALGQLDQADEVLRAASQRFPDSVNIQQASAELAEARGDLTLAALHWRAVVATKPDVWWTRSSLARVLARGGDRAGADDALAAAIAHMPDEPILYAEYAVMAAQDGRPDVAAARWAAARQRFGPHPTIAGGEANWLRGEGRLAEAKAILGAASQQAPDNAGLLHDLGHLAAQERDWPEAERCWRAILALQPQAGWAYGELARALREQGRVAEAEGVLAEAWAHHPQDFGIGAAWAREASEAKDWPEARRRWALLRERFPAEGHPVWQEAIALREAGETEQAAVLFAAGAERFPADASFPHDLARLAEARQDHAQAEHWWRRYQALQPDAWWGWLGLATAVHAQGRVEEAEELLLRGDEACPTIHAFLHMRAEWARHRGDWLEAERRATTLAERFPAAWEGIWGQAIAAREQGRADEARELLQRGAARYPGVATFAHDLARLAEAQGDHAEAERCWRRYTGLEPGAWWGWIGIAAALRAQGREEDAEAVLQEGGKACPPTPAFLHVHADWARQRQDWPEAERRAALLTAQFPEVWEGPWGQALAAREQGRLEDAWTILLGGAEQFPGNIFFAHDLASMAKVRADWGEAERWWRRYLELDDSQAWAHGELWAALEMQGRRAEADALLRAAIDRHRDEPAFHRQYAIAATQRGNPALALQRWEQVIERFPQDSHALRHLAGAYAANNETERAVRILESGLARSPEERDFALSLLEIALRRGETTAVARWRAHLVDMLRPALEQQPDDPDLLVDTFHTLKDLPQANWPIPAARVERSMRAAIERGNANGFLHAAYAAMAAGRGDWVEQHRRLDASVRRFPTDSFLRTKMFEAREIILAQGEDDTPAIRSPSSAQAVAADMPAADVVLQFESLGGGGANEVGRAFGCEFGYVQREYGQEPLSLLRWASIGRSNLIRALHERFAGFGKAENIELNEEHGDDWGAIDTVYRSQFDHTHLSRATVTRQEAQRLIAMRMKFLARKLINDLTSGEKIFVYRVIDCTLDESTILRLAWEVNRYGNNVLLFVTLADDRHPAFHVRHVHPGLMIGYIDYFEVSFGHAQGRNHTGWLQLCREALRVWRAGAPETPELPKITDNEGEAQAQAEIPQAPRGDDVNKAMLESPSAPADTSDAPAIPRDFTAACAWARLAADASDWAEARHRWAQLRDRFPAEGHPWWQEGVALRESGNPDEARALFLAGLERYPADPSFAHDLARLAEARQDHAEAEHYWHRYLSLMPNAWWGWFGVATAVHAQGRIDEAEALLLRGHTACPDTALFLAVHAQWARDRRDWAEAERRAAVLMERFPNAWDGLWGTAVVAREQGRLDEAEALLLRGAELHPAIAAFPHDLARLAEGRADWPTAARWWLVYLRLDPSAVWVWMWLARQLSEHGELAEAETVLVTADTAHPSDPAYLLFHANLAERRADWAEAEHRYEAVMARWPGLPDAIRGQARALRQQGRHDKATELLRAAAERHPEVAAAFARDLAQAAEGARDWQGAAYWWGTMLAADDNAPGWIHGARAHCLQVMGQHDVADAELLAAIARRPDAVELHHEYARAADRLGHRAESLQRWARAAERFPDDSVAVSMLGMGIAGTGGHAAATRLLQAAARRLPGNWTVERALLQVAALREQPEPYRTRPRLVPPPVRLNVSPGTEDADAIAEVERITGMAIRSFIMQFDTLGESCEFGFIQRYCGAEPLGLMRFAGMACTDMARAIRSEFAGLGERLMAHGDDGWDVTDLTYRMAYHTFRPKTEPEAVLLAGEPRRLRFLARKLLGDIDEAGKIFVVWRAFIGMTPSVVQPLIDAVHARNPKATVVFVTPGAAVGSAERVGPYLFRGHVRALAHYTHQAGASVHHWLEMLVNVWLQMRDSQPREASGGQDMIVPSQDDESDDAVLQAARAELPEQLDLAFAWAERATQSADWAEARRRWAWVTARCPDEPEPALHEATAARRAGDVAAARALLLAAAERHPDHANIAHDLARLAEADADWAGAEQWWGRFVGLDPDAWWGRLGLAWAIRAQGRRAEADDLLARAIEASPSEPGLLQAHAEWAREEGDWPEAERRARLLMERVPDAWQARWTLAVTAREQGRLDEAENLLREGFERHPNNIHFPNDLAHLAQARGDWAAAEQWWRALLAIDPNIWWAHAALARALHQQGRRSDADAVLLAAHAALPGEPNILFDHARLAEQAGDWPAALERWTLIVDQLPSDPRGHLERAAALRQLGRHEEAEAALIAAAERFPHEPRPLHDLARAAEMRADWAAAERWWRAHGAIDPNAWEAQVGLAGALCQQGDVAPAMAILHALAARPYRDAFCIAMMAAVAFDHAPDVTAPWLEQLAEDLAKVVHSGQASPVAWLAHANVAKRHEQFEECRARLEDAAARFPDDRGIWLTLADARELALRDNEARPVGPAHTDQDADRRLLESFESLGGTPGGCEFGLHQREHGLEPLSLLRWASIAPDQLCRLLEQHCEGLGAPQTVSLRTQGHYDWQAVELTYGIRMDHTHLDRKTVPIETATRLVCTRLKFLARKLIDDLRTGEKVFVYRLSDATIPPDLAARLQQAVAAYGDARLLLVGEGTPATPPIELQRLSPRCLQIIRAPIGQIATHEARLASWQAICRAAAAEFGLAAMAEAGTP